MGQLMETASYDLSSEILWQSLNFQFGRGDFWKFSLVADLGHVKMFKIDLNWAKMENKAIVADREAIIVTTFVAPLKLQNNHPLRSTYLKKTMV